MIFFLDKNVINLILLKFGVEFWNGMRSDPIKPTQQIHVL